MQAGVDLREPAAVIDAVGDKGKARGVQTADVLEEILLENVAVQRGDAVDDLAGGEAHVRHVHLALGDDEVAADALVVAELLAEVIAPAAVDLADDLPDAGHLALNEALRPSLERLGHDGVVRVVKALGDNLPRLVPLEIILVHEDAHELGDHESRVRVVDLDDVMLGEVPDRAIPRAVGAHDALRRGGDEEILLAEAERLALQVIVRRIEHLGDDLGHRAVLERLHIVAGGEGVHVEIVGAVRLPEAEGVHARVVIARDEHVARHGDDGLITHELAVIVAELIPVRLDAAAEANLHGVLIARDEPALGRGAPIVGDLGLAAVFYLLAEHAELIAETVSRGGDVLRGHAVHIAGGETAQTAVAEAGVRLGLKDIGGGAAHILQRAGERLGHAEVKRVLHQAAAHQELHGQIMHLALGRRAALERQNAAHDLADDDGAGLEHLFVRCVQRRDAEVRAELVLNGAAHLVTGDLIGHTTHVFKFLSNCGFI